MDDRPRQPVRPQTRQSPLDTDAIRAGSLGRDTAVACVALALASVGLFGLSVTVDAGPTFLDTAGPPDLDLTGASVLGVAMRAVSLVGSTLIFWAITLGLSISIARQSHRGAVGLAGAALVAEGCTLAMKFAIGRARPPGATATDLFVDAGFPSGHVTRVAVVLGACLVVVPAARRHPRLWIATAIVGVLVMSVARVSVGDHYVTDVLGGMLLGALLVAALAVIRWRARPRIDIARASRVVASLLIVPLVVPVAVSAASPAPSMPIGGDPRSSGQGPGFIGDAPTAIAATFAIGAGAALVTYVYIRVTGKRRSP